MAKKKKAKARAKKEHKAVEIVEDQAKKATGKRETSKKKVAAEVVDSPPSEKITLTEQKLPALGDGLSSYMAAINKYPLLTREQELEIAKRYKEEGKAEDAEILVTSNLRFVVKVAAEYSQFGAKLIDLIQEGNVGLMHAVREYNPYKGVRLITYAVWWIRGYIQEYMMRQYSMVRIGTTHNQRKLFYKLQKEKTRLDQLGQEPTVRLLSANLGVPEKDVEMMQMRMGRKDLSLDQPLKNDESSSLMDFEASEDPSVDDELINHESLAQLGQAIASLKGSLSEKETYILENRLLNDEPLKLQQIGDKWGVTREAVRQMEARLMKKIKSQLQAQ